MIKKWAVILLTGILCASTPPRGFEYYYYKGFKAIKQGNAPAALCYLDSACWFNPKADSVFTLKAHAYYLLGKPDEAMANCNIAYGLNPQNPYLYFVRGITKSITNVTSDSLYKIIKKHKKDTAWLAHNILNRYYFTNYGTYDYKKAIQDIDTCIAMYDRFPQAYSHRGFFYYWLGNYDKAIEDYTKCIALEPENPYHYLDRGKCFEMLWRVGDARDDYTKGISLDSNIAELYEKRGKLYFYAWMDREYACKDLRKAMLLGRYIEDIDQYCKPDFMDKLDPERYYNAPWRHDSRPCVCPDFEAMFNPETDTIKEIEIVPGHKVKMLDIKDSEKTTWEFEDGRVIEISKETKERWLREEKNRNPLP